MPDDPAQCRHHLTQKRDKFDRHAKPACDLFPENLEPVGNAGPCNGQRIFGRHVLFNRLDQLRLRKCGPFDAKRASATPGLDLLID